MIDTSVWTDAGYSARFSEATETFKTSPGALTDDDIRVLDQYHGNAPQLRRARDAARAQAAAVPRTAAPTPRVKSPEEYADENGRWRDAVFHFLVGDFDRKDEKANIDAMSRLWQCGKGLDQTIKLIPILQYMQASNERNKQRNKSIESLESRLTTLESSHALDIERITSLESRLATLDARLASLEAAATSSADELKQYVAKQLAEAPANEEIEARLERLNGLIVLHDSRFQRLEADVTKPRDPECKEFERGRVYKVGEFATYKKGVWVAVRNCETVPGARLGDWECIMSGSAQP